MNTNDLERQLKEFGFSNDEIENIINDYFASETPSLDVFVDYVLTDLIKTMKL